MEIKYRPEIDGLRSITVLVVVFLQDLLLKKKYSNYFDRWKNEIKNFSHFIQENKINPINFCFKFAMNTKKIKKVVIRVQNCKQLEEIISNSLKKNEYSRNVYKNFIIKDHKLLIPNNWKI